MKIIISSVSNFKDYIETINRRYRLEKDFYDYFIELETENEIKDLIWFMYKEFGDIVIYKKDTVREGYDMEITIYDDYIE